MTGWKLQVSAIKMLITLFMWAVSGHRNDKKEPKDKRRFKREMRTKDEIVKNRNVKEKRLFHQKRRELANKGGGKRGGMGGGRGGRGGRGGGRGGRGGRR